jgi:hypothetical protein
VTGRMAQSSGAEARFDDSATSEMDWAGFVKAANPYPAGPGRYPDTSYPWDLSFRLHG